MTPNHLLLQKGPTERFYSQEAWLEVYECSMLFLLYCLVVFVCAYSLETNDSKGILSKNLSVWKGEYMTCVCVLGEYPAGRNFGPS